MTSLHYLIAKDISENTATIIGRGVGDDADVEYKNAVVKENYLTGRVYVVDKDDETKEYASLPLSITSIFVTNGK